MNKKLPPVEDPCQEFKPLPDFNKLNISDRLTGVACRAIGLVASQILHVEDTLWDKFPKAEAVPIAAKHSSRIADITLVGLVAYTARKRQNGDEAQSPAFISKREWLEGPWVKRKFFEKGGATIPVDRSKSEDPAYSRAKEEANRLSIEGGSRKAFEQTRDVIVFPEGRSSSKKAVGKLYMKGLDMVIGAESPDVLPVLTLRRLGFLSYGVALTCIEGEATEETLRCALQEGWSMMDPIDGVSPAKEWPRFRSSAPSIGVH